MATGTSGPPGRGGRPRACRRRPAAGLVRARARGVLARAVPRLREGVPARHPDSGAVRITGAQAGWLAAADRELWPRHRRPVLGDQPARLGRWLGRPVWAIWIPVPLRERSCVLASRLLAALVRPLAFAAAALAVAHALLAPALWTAESAIVLYVVLVKVVVIRVRPRAGAVQPAGAGPLPPRRGR